ncbi:putative tyrosyl-DNA phosphodiesterase [Hyphodiscus hymeniophilus]|uniref:Tyrosyl-DNA phosphodiesterase n=1 Tax=Hyphodiscus hymeniophilus TaxID=353542 RepID=A0A9P6VJJ3_9HELO|nr:putative tyrosyl-DNA phosphodiesterase [Hyphodiscus hymeniophilus]
MADMFESGERSRKRQRLRDQDGSANRGDLHRSLAGSISPPPLRRTKARPAPKIVPSPFQLTWITNLPASSNLDAVSLKDILGDPLIAECWEFNYLHDLDFLMDAFDPDVRDLVKVHVIHGFWKNEDPSRLHLKEQSEKYKNLNLHTAFMPEMFGTHHSKMLILIRHDDTAQVVIHTANMIPFDWGNMSQGLWRSPLLPLRDETLPPEQAGQIGSGSRFKTDLINYLKAYDTKRIICKPLIAHLSKYNFSAIKATLIASVPGKQEVDGHQETSWGWLGLKNALKAIPVHGSEPEIIVQISSIATLGGTDKWLEKTLFKALSTSKNVATTKPKFRVIFPTADEIRRSLNGYNSGSAIHTRIQSAAQAKQLQYLKPLFCHWAGDGAQHTSASASAATISDAGRKRAAPHIKTYVRFADKDRTSIDWKLVTSANLSTQAWGAASNAVGEVRICSYEIGVLVWPGLFGENATMVPTFKTDIPAVSTLSEAEIVVGARMSYDLPLVPYAKDDIPWVASATYTEPDWNGSTWNVD